MAEPNTPTIRIRSETKTKIDGLMLKRMNEDKNPHYSYGDFISELVEFYLINK